MGVKRLCACENPLTAHGAARRFGDDAVSRVRGGPARVDDDGKAMAMASEHGSSAWTGVSWPTAIPCATARRGSLPYRPRGRCGGPPRMDMSVPRLYPRNYVVLRRSAAERSAGRGWKTEVVSWA
jgi:hypothetical protein